MTGKPELTHRKESHRRAPEVSSYEVSHRSVDRFLPQERYLDTVGALWGAIRFARPFLLADARSRYGSGLWRRNRQVCVTSCGRVL